MKKPRNGFKTLSNKQNQGKTKQDVFNVVFRKCVPFFLDFDNSILSLCVNVGTLIVTINCFSICFEG